MRFIALFCLGFESMKGLGHIHKYSTSFTHSFQPQATSPQAKLPMFQQKVNNEVDESTYSNPPIGQPTEPRVVHEKC